MVERPRSTLRETARAPTDEPDRHFYEGAVMLAYARKVVFVPGSEQEPAGVVAHPLVLIVAEHHNLLALRVGALTHEWHTLMRLESVADRHPAQSLVGGAGGRLVHRQLQRALLVVRPHKRRIAPSPKTMPFDAD